MVYVSADLWRLKGDVGYHGAGITRYCEPSDVSVGKLF